MGKGDDYQDMDETTYILDGRSQKPAKAERSSQMLSFFAGAPRAPDGHPYPSHSCAHCIAPAHAILHDASSTQTFAYASRVAIVPQA